MTNRLANKVAIVTGGGSGIGRAPAPRLSAEGAQRGIIDLNRDNAEETQQTNQTNGGDANAVNIEAPSENDRPRADETLRFRANRKPHEATDNLECLLRARVVVRHRPRPRGHPEQDDADRRRGDDGNTPWCRTRVVDQTIEIGQRTVEP